MTLCGVVPEYQKKRVEGGSVVKNIRGGRARGVLKVGQRGRWTGFLG